MRGWAVYIRPLSGKGHTLYAYTCFGFETKGDALEALRDLGIPALFSPLFEAVLLPVLRVSDPTGKDL